MIKIFKMQKTILITVLFLFTFLNGFSQSVVNVDASKFFELTQSGNGIILDVRTPQEYSRGHIKDATLIDVSNNQFPSKINLLQKDKPVYVYCLTGSRSRSAASYMVRIGFTKVYNLQSGILDWQRSGFPIVQSNATVSNTSKKYTADDFQNLISTNKLVLVDFNAPWCAPCKQMIPTIDKLSQTYKGKLTVEKIDMESNRALADANQVKSIPGFILFRNGQKIWTYKGVISYEDLASIINKNL